MGTSNPFATRFTQPGKLTPLDPAARPVDLPGLLDRLDQIGRMAAIVGPHGSGKSSLLLRLLAEGGRRGRPGRHLRLRSWRDGIAAVVTVVRTSRESLVCLDSWECLGAVTRSAIRAAAAARGCRLVVTCHQATAMPTLTRCRPTPELFEALVRLLPDAAEWFGTLIDPADVRAAFDHHRGDIRESLFELYDLFEMRRAAVKTARS